MQIRHPVASLAATIVITLTLLAIGAVLCGYSGIYDVSASSKDNPIIGWMLHSTYEASLHHHAGNDVPPGDLMSLKNIEAGARFYDSTCAACHGVPGRPLSFIGQGIQPAAPALLAATRRNNPKLMFWVIKHGINMTAMPSFGKTQTDQTIWQTAAFLYDARGITQQRYETLVHGSK
jgi:cytochrome c